ncbi:MAG TPA: SEC-C metal-binding domain-containing protein [Chromatiaceae bacterium]|nr:SEC-C metal-binding domain-containing protein [Chromatiaceae bacterium]
MTDLISLAKGKLNDPILMEWALRHYQDAQAGTPQRREAMEQDWFDDLTLRRWLDSDDQAMLARLFSELPADRFANLGPSIGARWGQWGGNLACAAAPVLARHAPDLAWRCFAEPEAKRHRDMDAVLGIVHALPLLPPEPARALLGAIAEEVRGGRHSQLALDTLWNGLLWAGLRIDRPVAEAAIQARLGDGSDDRALEDTLGGIARGLFGSRRYARLASDIRQGQTRQDFRSLSALFRDDAPLDRLDQWSRGQVTRSDLTGLVAQYIDDDDRRIILAVLHALGTQGVERHWDRLADFLIGCVAAACERDAIDTSQMPLQETVGLLAADLSSLPQEEALSARLADFDQGAVADMLSETLQREKGAYGGMVIARVMGRLGWEAFVPVLTDSINDESGDLVCDAARDALVRLGEPARDHLIAHWDRLDVVQRIYGLSVIVTVGGEPVASFAFDQQHDLLREDPESWCQLALAAPDQRLVERLERELPRRQGLFDETFYQLVHLLGLDHPRLAAVAERVRRRRAEQQARSAAFERGDWFQETLSLPLRCPACGDTNEYAVRRVAVMPMAVGDQPLLGQELACSSCGQWADLEITNEARLVLAGEFIRLGAERLEGLAGKSKVLAAPAVSLNGRLRPVVEVVSHCRDAVAEHPAAVGDWVRLAYCYQRALDRPRHGGRYAEQALRQDPNAVEAVILRAHALTLEGEEQQAFDLLDRALAAKDQWRFFLRDLATPAEVAAQFAGLYNELRHRLGRGDRPSLHGAFLAAKTKVGRNDPCPCGSGRKYKKCCLRGP